MRFVSHAWLEPVCKFVACLKCHASLRQLPDQTAYWVCAYANNQNNQKELEKEIGKSPEDVLLPRHQVVRWGLAGLGPECHALHSDLCLEVGLQRVAVGARVGKERDF